MDPHDAAWRRRSPARAAFLSFLWPGLGQWYSRRPRLGAVFAIPVAIVLGGVGLAAAQDPQGFGLTMFDPTVAISAIVLIVLLGGWRIVSMAHAQSIVGGPRAFRGRPLTLFAGLTAAVVVSHLLLASLAFDFYRAGSRIFIADPIPTQPVRSPAPAPSLQPGLTPPPTATPEPEPDPTGRINILITGIDSAPSRSHALTDTLIVVSFDPVTEDAVMISLPRDIARIPLWDGRHFAGKINSLMSHADQRPVEFPDGGMATLTREVGFLLGLQIDYYAALNFAGFQRMIDEVGGVTIVNERVIDDPTTGFYLSAGTHTLDSRTALAYVTSRKGAGDNDFTRARRQQQVLVAIRDKLSDPTMLPRLPGVLDAASQTITTNVPPARLAQMLRLGQAVSGDGIKSFVLGPPYSVHPPTNTTGGIYILLLDLERVAKLSVDLFGSDSRYAATGRLAPGPGAQVRRT